MQIVLPPELEQLVQRQISSGNYQTAIEVLLAGVRLLEAQNQQNAIPTGATDRSIGEETFGELNEHFNFSPLTETQMIQQSLDVLANYQHDAIPHDQIEVWVKSLGTDHEQPCPQ